MKLVLIGPFLFRFWGKIYGIEKNYYVVEAELGGPNAEDLWVSAEEETPRFESNNPMGFPNHNFISGKETYERARSAVTDPNVLIPYQET